MKNLIYVQDGLGKGKSLAILDDDIISVDSKTFAENRNSINLKGTIKLWENSNPYIRIFKKGFGWSGYLVEGTLNEKDSLNRSLGFISYYNGNENTLASFITENLKKANLSVKGIDKVHKRIKSYYVIKIMALLMSILITVFTIKNH